MPKTVLMNTRVTADQLAAIRESAAAANLTPSAFLREAALEKAGMPTLASRVGALEEKINGLAASVPTAAAMGADEPDTAAP